MNAAQSRLDIATGNLANVSTDGFRRVLARGVMTSQGAKILATPSSESGALQHTGRPFDFAIVGDGCFRVRDAAGQVHATRNGSFVRDRYGALRDGGGRALLGLHGTLRVPEGAALDSRGRITLGGRTIDRIPLGPGATLHEGYLECANVNAIEEMVGVLAAQRSFESAGKVLAAIDGVRQKASNDVARIK